MKKFVFIFGFIFVSYGNIFAEEYSMKSIGKNNFKTMIIDNEKLSIVEVEFTWIDSLANYGTGFCYGSILNDESEDPGCFAIIKYHDGITVTVDNSWRDDQTFGATVLGTSGEIQCHSRNVLLGNYALIKDNGFSKTIARSESLNSPMKEAICNIVNHVRKGEILKSDSKRAIKIMELVCMIYESSDKNKCIRNIDPTYIKKKFKSRFTSGTRKGIK